MQRTPPSTDRERQQQSAASRSETDQESDSGKVTRRRLKRMRSPEMDLDATLTFKLNTFKHEITEHITNLFTSLQESQDKKLSAISSDMSDLKREMKDLKKCHSDLEQQVSTLTSNFEMCMEKNSNTFKKVEQLEQQQVKYREYITLMEDKLEDMQRSCRKTSIEIKNVPKHITENKEDLVNMMLHLGKTIHCNISKNDIKDIYRVRETRNGHTRTPIIAELSSIMLKTDILKKSKSFNSENKDKLRAKHLGLKKDEETPIFVSEQLTLRASRLFFLARDLVKTQKYKYCWASFGKIYLRQADNTPVIQIKTENQVQSLFQAS